MCESSVSSSLNSNAEKGSQRLHFSAIMYNTYIHIQLASSRYKGRWMENIALLCIAYVCHVYVCIYSS